MGTWLPAAPNRANFLFSKLGSFGFFFVISSAKWFRNPTTPQFLYHFFSVFFLADLGISIPPLFLSKSGIWTKHNWGEKASTIPLLANASPPARGAAQPLPNRRLHSLSVAPPTAVRRTAHRARPLPCYTPPVGWHFRLPPVALPAPPPRQPLPQRSAPPPWQPAGPSSPADQFFFDFPALFGILGLILWVKRLTAFLLNHWGGLVAVQPGEGQTNK